MRWAWASVCTRHGSFAPATTCTPITCTVTSCTTITTCTTWALTRTSTTHQVVPRTSGQALRVLAFLRARFRASASLRTPRQSPRRNPRAPLHDGCSRVPARPRRDLHAARAKVLHPRRAWIGRRVWARVIRPARALRPPRLERARHRAIAARRPRTPAAHRRSLPHRGPTVLPHAPRVHPRRAARRVSAVRPGLRARRFAKRPRAGYNPIAPPHRRGPGAHPLAVVRGGDEVSR